ncbi:EAL domain-containing protein [Enterobacter ludwigii]|uniref:EAL domain-containing protein n=1 Tax=Enterobacter ludwigii TaxID=299767 RepID=UPI003FD45991
MYSKCSYDLLTDALINKLIHLCYQPIIDTSTGGLFGLEVLARWKDKEQKFISPLEFIVDFENAGLARALSNYMMELIVDDINSLEHDRFNNINLSVNFNPVTLENDDFISDYLLYTKGFVNKEVIHVVEVTERHGLNMKSKNTLISLRSHGVKVYLDDFGVEYSNFDRLLELKPNGIKLDNSLISEDDNCLCWSITDSMLKLAHKINVEIVVEGVESNRIRDRLISMGASIQQGYIHGKPMDIESLRLFFL